VRWRNIRVPLNQVRVLLFDSFWDDHSSSCSYIEKAEISTTASANGNNSRDTHDGSQRGHHDRSSLHGAVPIVGLLEISRPIGFQGLGTLPQTP
jgi:hypothetical protein